MHPLYTAPLSANGIKSGAFQRFGVVFVVRLAQTKSMYKPHLFSGTMAEFFKAKNGCRKTVTSYIDSGIGVVFVRTTKKCRKTMTIPFVFCALCLQRKEDSGKKNCSLYNATLSCKTSDKTIPLCR